MKSILLRGICAAVVSLLFAVPAYAQPMAANGGNGGLGNGMGSIHGMHDRSSANRHGAVYVQSNDGPTRVNASSIRDVSVYGTGTGSQFRNVNANAPGTVNGNPGYRMQSNTNNGYRTLDTTPSRGMDWGWLGLLGLLGLFGIRSRNPQRDR